MDCPSCGHSNPKGARFCGACATLLSGAVACPGCGASNPAEQRFCNACGQALSSEPSPPAIAPDVSPPAAGSNAPSHLAEKIRGSRSALEGERKQVTVLFADVTGSMG